jgi:hypothetical protein
MADEKIQSPEIRPELRLDHVKTRQFADSPLYS